MATYRTTLYSALDPVAGVGANLQQTVTINNDVTYATAATVSVTNTLQTLAVLANVPNAISTDTLIITNLDTTASTDVVTLANGTGVIPLNSGAQFMISGIRTGINASAWTLRRFAADGASAPSVANGLVRIEFAI